MADTLAEALVKVKLVYDSTEIKKSTTAAVQDSTKVYKSQIGELKKMSRGLSTIATAMHKVSALMLKSVVLPLVGLGTLGVHKFMTSTAKGATELRSELHDLKSSWDQFLGRIGRVIYNSGILTKVIEKLKIFLDSLNDEKIARILNRAMWMGVLAIIMKITADIMKWVAMIPKVIAGLKTLRGLKLATDILGPVAGQAVSSSVKGFIKKEGGTIAGTAVGSAVGTGGTLGIIYKFKEISNAFKVVLGSIKNAIIANTELSRIMKNGTLAQKHIYAKQLSLVERLIVFKNIGSSYKEERAMAKIGRDLFGRFISKTEKSSILGQTNTPYVKSMIKFSESFKVLEKLGVFFKAIGDIAAKLVKILLVFDIVAAFLRGGGFKIKDGLSLIWNIIKGIWEAFKFMLNAIEFVTGLIVAPFEALGNAIKTIYDLFFSWIFGVSSKKNTTDILNEADKRNVDIWKRAVTWDKSKLDKESGKLSWQKGKISTTSFEGLNALAQDLAVNEDSLAATKANTEATKANTDALLKQKNLPPNVIYNGGNFSNPFKNINVKTEPSIYDAGQYLAN